MKVWVLQEEGYERHFCGVFSTEEKAKVAMSLFPDADVPFEVDIDQWFGYGENKFFEVGYKDSEAGHRKGPAYAHQISPENHNNDDGIWARGKAEAIAILKARPVK